jgi:hypothetical protein
MAKYYDSMGGEGKHANLPTEPMFKNWESDKVYMTDDLDDGMGGIDAQISADASKRNKHTAAKKV